MAAVTLSKPSSPAGEAWGDAWVQIPASWAAYQRLLRDRGERGRPKYTYIDGRLTIVSPGTPHEVLKTRMGGLIESLCEALDIDMLAFGETLYLKTARGKAGSEPDESYYLTRLDAVRGKEKVVMGVDPAPDLIVEVVFSHPVADALEAYRRFGVREVWIARRADLEILALDVEGHYGTVPRSVNFPFLSTEEIASWALRDDFPSDTKLRRAFRTWVDTTLAPRQRNPS